MGQEQLSPPWDCTYQPCCLAGGKSDFSIEDPPRNSGGSSGGENQHGDIRQSKTLPLFMTNELAWRWHAGASRPSWLQQSEPPRTLPAAELKDFPARQPSDNRTDRSW